MRLNFLKSPICLIAALVILVVCVLEMTRVQAFQRLEWMTYDWRVRLAHNYASHSANDATNLGLVEISDNTIAAVNSGEFGYQIRSVLAKAGLCAGLGGIVQARRQGGGIRCLFAERRPDHRRFSCPTVRPFHRMIILPGN